MTLFGGSWPTTGANAVSNTAEIVGENGTILLYENGTERNMLHRGRVALQRILER
jgi:hypothetical protein